QKESSALGPALVRSTSWLRVSECLVPYPPIHAHQKPECACAWFVITPGEPVQPRSPSSKSPLTNRFTRPGEGVAVGTGPGLVVGVAVLLGPGVRVCVVVDVERRGDGVAVGPGTGLNSMERIGWISIPFGEWAEPWASLSNMAIPTIRTGVLCPE